jgi:hypothetical protein
VVAFEIIHGEDSIRRKLWVDLRNNNSILFNEELPDAGLCLGFAAVIGFLFNALAEEINLFLEVLPVFRQPRWQQ